jgi:hypothetical protein
MKLDKSTFWEYDITTLNPAEDYATIIPRIAMRGTYNEWLEMRKYYGDEKIIGELKQVRYLDTKTFHFISSLFDIPKEEFRCYIMKQSNPEPWDF